MPTKKKTKKAKTVPTPVVEILESPEQRRKLGQQIESHIPRASDWCDEMGFDCVSHAIEEYGLGDDKAAAKMVERDITEWVNRQEREDRRNRRDWNSHDEWINEDDFDDFGDRW